jgi:hypothetical protein
MGSNPCCTRVYRSRSRNPVLIFSPAINKTVKGFQCKAANPFLIWAWRSTLVQMETGLGII